MEFQSFPKMPRLSREVIVTEKIDGTNAQIFISEPDENGNMTMMAGSRTRWITPDNDNAGFARWCRDNAQELMQLGPGRHFGEWWGQGIQRGYGLKEKRFSLFNVVRWTDEVRPQCCYVVPVLWRGMFDTLMIDECLSALRVRGSQASPGFINPEGIDVFHTAGNFGFKKTLVKDDKPKSVSGV
jgi:hypothetical protein